MSAGLRVIWSDDWDVGSHAEFYGEGSCYVDPIYEPETCETCRVEDSAGNVLASLSCIDDADDAYRREIESELMDEARSELNVTILAEYA